MMKRNILPLIVVGLMWLTAPSVSAQTADSLVSEARAALSAEDLATARTKLEAALALEASHDNANVLLAVVRLADIVNRPDVQTFLTRLGVGSVGRSVYDWTAKPNEDPGGSLVVPTGVSAGEFAQNWRTNAVPEISAAIANLAQVTDTGFLISLSAAETTAQAVDVDYGDLLVLRAGLQGFIYFSHTMLAHDFNAQLSVLESMADAPGGFSIQRLLADHPQLLAYATTADLAAARTAFENLVDQYVTGSAILHARPVGVTRLFNFASNSSQLEQRFRETLQDLKASLVSATPLRHGEGQYTFFAADHFAPGSFIRSWLPQFRGSRMVLGSMADPTFGGFLTGRSVDDVEGFVFGGSRSALHRNFNLGGIPTVPALGQAQRPSGQPFRFRTRTQIGRGYVVEASSDFRQWNQVDAYVSLDGSVEFNEPPGTTPALRFYRVVDRDSSMPPPANDQFQNRRDLGNGSQRVIGYNRNASFDSGGPLFGFNAAGRSVWYSWTAPATAQYQIKPAARSWPHPGVAVFTGSSLGSLSRRSSSSFGTAHLSASAGTTYHIVVDGTFNGFGSDFTVGGFRLSVSQPPTVTVVAPAQGSTHSSSSSVQFEFSASDPDGNVTRVEFWLPGTGQVRLTTSPYRYTWNNPPAGGHGIGVNVYDDADITGFNSVFIQVNP